jgi:hypothetical protein
MTTLATAASLTKISFHFRAASRRRQDVGNASEPSAPAKIWSQKFGQPSGRRGHLGRRHLEVRPSGRGPLAAAATTRCQCYKTIPR